MNALERWRCRPMQVRILERCNECGELKDDVQKRVNRWPNVAALSCAKCFAEMTANAGDMKPTAFVRSREIS
ncbi:hypothetical protein LMG28614_06966 [Paraburkholderia ultramafica]|uniref:Uncharacterized protein n=1 Tax=Paraburkholderia ultramafica TaxID=1544867 RepID=A0A6S7BQ14_9BURK|nr:hypothetical protein [Paraburkholderia ultramafica]CAB3809161.1 hypothetical protein LMG28614_06966 [Paraburkholderia ultramafica]